MGPNILMGRAAVRRRHILPDAGAMEGDFHKHAVAVDRIESILEVQADNDKVGEILLVCHQAVEGMDEAFCTPSDPLGLLPLLPVRTPDSGVTWGVPSGTPGQPRRAGGRPVTRPVTGPFYSLNTVYVVTVNIVLIL
jgi:hypothetical protein